MFGVGMNGDSWPVFLTQEDIDPWTMRLKEEMTATIIIIAISTIGDYEDCDMDLTIFDIV